jgi:hypothetical protein
MSQHYKTPGVSWTKNRLDHLSACRGNLVCPGCGRKMCEGCTTQDNEMFAKKGHKGECLICSGMFTEEGIILHPANNSHKKKICNHSDKRYRLIRLEGK